MAKVSIIICNRQKTFSKCNKKPKAVLFSDKKKRVIFTEIELETARLAEKAQIRFLR